MNTSERFFEELQRAIARGFTLAGVSAALSCGTPAVRLDPTGASQTVEVLDPIVAHQADGGQLAQVPSNEIFCDGMRTQLCSECCRSVYCYEPTDGVCADQLPVNSASFSYRPCSASVGPFAQPDGGTTGCCYVRGYESCVVGRPLREGAEALVAAVVSRSDWAA
jgi:hypothetical protein